MATRATLLTIIAAAIAISSNAWSYTINGGATDVGGIDTLLGETNSLHDSGQTTETNWVNTIVNPDVTWSTKTDPVSYFHVDNNANLFAFELQNEPGYFIVKNAHNWALFSNLDNLGWGVFDLSKLTLSRWNLGGDDQLTISHVSEFNGRSSVPEPSSLALVIAGIAGLAYVRLRRNATA